MAYYSVDTDLLNIRPDILEYGIDDWSQFHEEAYNYINTSLEKRWYRDEAVERGIDWETTPFSPDQVDTSQIKKLACYKVLALAYEYLMKPSP